MVVGFLDGKLSRMAEMGHPQLMVGWVSNKGLYLEKTLNVQKSLPLLASLLLSRGCTE